jgi:hypothetical protein
MSGVFKDHKEKPSKKIKKCEKKSTKKLKRIKASKSRTKFMLSDCTKEFREYFKNLSKEEQSDWINYMVYFNETPTAKEAKKEDKISSKRQDKIDAVRYKALKNKKIKSISDYNKALGKIKKDRRRIEKLIEKEKSISKILNPESYVGVKVDVDQYRKDLKKAAKAERKMYDKDDSVLDCSLEAYKKALEENRLDLNDQFYLKHGYY